MKEKIYKVTYKSGIVREYRAYSMELKDGKLYQGIPSVIDGANIVSVVEKGESK